MPRKKVTFVSEVGGDWEGMYLGDELVCEGHSLRVGEVLEILGISYGGFEIDMGEHDISRCPPSLKDAAKMKTRE